MAYRIINNQLQQTKIEFTKANGDIYAILERAPDNAYLFARWTGIQTMETIQEGGKVYLDVMQQYPASKLLNSHKELIGPWDFANEWISQVWTPKAVELGMRYMAQVLAPGVYGQMSFHQLHQRIGNLLEVKMFDNEESAKEWLLSV
ncbi:hypothetical protein [Pontibacter cellulosilyticus]|uniref:STAS/SEC14 domain-containing protein n=1 Tax=Pontibacter cellulosilyticus TaxID=1720253 RepID=A0A923N8S1_9BACT|nr:hypothetical protein [Pontibacter cellulosilyticus]MBC5992525.1 hypothetical protein [Pontibacter cellulosilyticus]